MSRMSFRVECIWTFSCGQGGGTEEVRGCGGETTGQLGAHAAPTTSSASEPLGCSAAVDFRNVLITLWHTLFQSHSYYKWFKFNEKGSPEVENIETSKIWMQKY